VANEQAQAVRALGGTAVAATGHVAPDKLTTLSGFSAVVWWGDHTSAQTYAKALASRDGPILPLIVGHPDKGYVLSERHVCIDTTASGGNAALLAGKA
jgi:RHH-type proline utilization regulon transcriptional repressor/proline dehydrogenase/delta 1-pyrroline-5-carboxylate dehydrogenase